MNSKTIGRYEILDELGHGAMGGALRARDPVMGREVAIKSIHAAPLAGEQGGEFRERFYREARAARALSHPGIVQVFDAGEGNGVFYLVMELVQGRTLDAAMKQGERYSLERVCEIGQQIAEALDFAHRSGAIHGEIKPANILMTSREAHGEERPRITNFGVARLAGGEMAAAGQLVETPAFRPPEQFTGAPMDKRTDLLALGVILYWMTTGEQPFAVETLKTNSSEGAQSEPIPPSKLNPAVPPQLDEVILKCLAKNPEERYQTGDELAVNLALVRLADLRFDTDLASPGTLPAMESGAGERIHPVSGLQPKAARIFAGTAPPAVTMQSAPSAAATHGIPSGAQATPVKKPAPPAPRTSRTFIPSPHSDDFVSQAPADEADEAPAPGRRRGLLVLVGLVILAAAVVAASYLLHEHAAEFAQPAPTLQPTSKQQAPAAATPPADAARETGPEEARQPATTRTAAAGFNPTTLDPATNTHLKVSLDGFPAPLNVTLQMDGKVYWSGATGGRENYQELLVPPGNHQLRVVVHGQGTAKTSNDVDGEFAAKKGMTLTVKIRTQPTGDSAVLDSSSHVTVALAKDTLPQ